MIIEYSVALLEQLKLTPNEFFIITLIKHKEFDLLERFLKENYTRDESENAFRKFISLKYLTSTSYLKNSYDYSVCKLGNELNSKLRHLSICSCEDLLFLVVFIYSNLHDF